MRVRESGRGWERLGEVGRGSLVLAHADGLRCIGVEFASKPARGIACRRISEGSACANVTSNRESLRRRVSLVPLSPPASMLLDKPSHMALSILRSTSGSSLAVKVSLKEMPF